MLCPRRPACAGARLLILLSLAGLAAPARGAAPPHPRRPNLLVILVDTLRADRLSAYGYRRPTSPAVERLARRGVLFLDATTDSPWTKPAVTSLFTGLYPALHRVLESPQLRSGRSDALAPSALTLAERLAQAGYRTLAVSGNPHVRVSTGLLQGFQKTLNPGSLAPAENVHLHALTLLVEDRIDALGWPVLAARPDNRMRRADLDPIQRLRSPEGGERVVVGRVQGLEPGRLYLVGGRIRGLEESFGYLVFSYSDTAGRLPQTSARGADLEAWVTAWGLVTAPPGGALAVEAAFGRSRGAKLQQLEVADLAALPLSSLAAPRPAPTFLYLHLMDIHAPYRPPKELAQPYLAEPNLDRTPVPRDQLDRQIAVKDEERVGVYSALYDAQINAWDRELSAFLDQAAPLLKPEETIVVLTSDHGEGFLEHGLMSHANSLYQELLWVPLVLAGPGIPAGRRIESPVALVDVFPTVLALLDLPAPERLSGIDLAPLWQGSPEPAAPRPLYAFLRRWAPVGGFSEHLVLRRGPWKLIHGRGASGLFHLADDPGERRDLSSAEPQRAAELERELLSWQAEMAAAGEALALSVPQTLLEEERRRLEALGYAE